MRNFVLFFLMLAIMPIAGCTDGADKKVVPEEKTEQFVQTYDIARYKLYQTQNMWTFIKLDTQTGQMWQVQYSVNDDQGRFEYDLNPNVLAADAKKVNGRFELYPTQNIFNFILLDRVNGKSWQVQWSIDEENRAILPISK